MGDDFENAYGKIIEIFWREFEWRFMLIKQAIIGYISSRENQKARGIGNES